MGDFCCDVCSLLLNLLSGRYADSFYVAGGCGLANTGSPLGGNLAIPKPHRRASACKRITRQFNLWKRVK